VAPVRPRPGWEGPPPRWEASTGTVGAQRTDGVYHRPV